MQEYRVVLMLPVRTLVEATHPAGAAEAAKAALRHDYPNLITPPLLISVEPLEREHAGVDSTLPA